MESSQVAIITPNYNKGKYVVDCIQSVLNQNYANWELFFIDDGSTDTSLELAFKASSGDSRIHILKNDSGIKGANAARNYALQKVDSQYVLFLDSDDVMTSNCLSERVRDMENYPGNDFLTYPMGFFFDKPGDSDLISNIPTDQDDLDRFLARDVVWQISGPFWKSSALKKLRGFDLELNSQQDVDLHIRALIHSLNYHYLHKKPTILYRRNVDSEPRKLSQSAPHLLARKEMVFKHLKLLNEHKKLTEYRKILLARYILDIAQMMRWHQGKLGRNALSEALIMWEKAFSHSLIDGKILKLGRSYIRFKHQMLFNRFPSIQNLIENYFQRRLAEFIHKPSTTYAQVKLSDYAS